MYKFPKLFFPPTEFSETRNVNHIMCLVIFWILQTSLFFISVLLVSISIIMDSWDRGSIDSLYLETNYDISGNTSQVSQVLPAAWTLQGHCPVTMSHVGPSDPATWHPQPVTQNEYNFTWELQTVQGLQHTFGMCMCTKQMVISN